MNKIISILFLFFSLNTINAQVVSPFNIRYQVNQKGNITLLSNVAITCNSSNANCGTYQNQLPPTGNHNQDGGVVFGYVDTQTIGQIDKCVLAYLFGCIGIFGTAWQEIDQSQKFVGIGPGFWLVDFKYFHYLRSRPKAAAGAGCSPVSRSAPISAPISVPISASGAAPPSPPTARRLRLRSQASPLGLQQELRRNQPSLCSKPALP